MPIWLACRLELAEYGAVDAIAMNRIDLAHAAPFRIGILDVRGAGDGGPESASVGLPRTCDVPAVIYPRPTGVTGIHPAANAMRNAADRLRTLSFSSRFAR